MRIGFLGVGNFFQVELIQISNKENDSDLIFTISHFCSPTLTTFSKSVFVSLFFEVICYPFPSQFFSVRAEIVLCVL